MTKTIFFELYSHRFVKVNEDDTETGDFQLFCPEECDRAQEYRDKGYEVASVFETEDGTEYVKEDNDCGVGFHKIGFLILTPKFI